MFIQFIILNEKHTPRGGQLVSTLAAASLPVSFTEAPQRKHPIWVNIGKSNHVVPATLALNGLITLPPLSLLEHFHPALLCAAIQGDLFRMNQLLFFLGVVSAPPCKLSRDLPDDRSRNSLWCITHKLDPFPRILWKVSDYHVNIAIMTTRDMAKHFGLPLDSVHHRQRVIYLKYSLIYALDL